MRSRILARAVALVAAAASLAVIPAGAGSGATGPVPVTFSQGRWVDLQRLGAEPEIRIDSKGNEYVTAPIGIQYATSFLWKSEDGGQGFDLLRATPPLQRPNPSYASGDATMTIMPPAPGSKDDALVWSDLVNLLGLQNAATFDGGNTFPADHWNEYSTDAGPGADRQWLASMQLPNGTERVYEYYDNVDLAGNSIIYSDDYGKSWTVANRDEGLGQPNPGNIVADPVHQKLYMASVSGNDAIVSICDNAGQNCSEATAGSGQGGLANLFDIVAVDTAGNVYITFSDAKATYLSVSTDQGQTWTQTRVSPPDQKATVMPWVVAGDPGRVWVVWYGTPTAGGPSGNAGPWTTYAAESLNALDASPTFRTFSVSPHANHDNPVCEAGIGCTAGIGPIGNTIGGHSEDRNMLDDFSAAIDPRGMLHVAYNDTNNQVTQSSNPQAGGAFIVESEQLSGPSLYASVGDVTPSPDAPSVSSAAVDGSSLHVAGTHSLPPANWATDAAGDALYPRHSTNGPGSNAKPLDLTSVTLSGSGSTFSAHLRVNGAAGIPATADDRPEVYMVFFWTPPGAVYYAAVEYAGGQQVAAWVGQPDPAVVNSAGVPKIVTYQPAPKYTVPTTATLDEDGGGLTIQIPASAIGNPPSGTRFDDVQGFTYVVNGPPGAEALMDEADATPSTSWNVGDPQFPAGTVQLSVDDPTFALPTTATLTDYPGSDWSADLSTAGLTAGQHTLYVREVANGFASEPVSVAFSV